MLLKITVLSLLTVAVSSSHLSHDDLVISLLRDGTKDVYDDMRTNGDRNARVHYNMLTTLCNVYMYKNITGHEDIKKRLCRAECLLTTDYNEQLRDRWYRGEC